MTKSQHYSVAHVFEKLASKSRVLAEDRSASVALEYALLSGGIGVGIAGVMSFLGTGISEIFETLSFALCRVTRIVCLM